MIPQYATENKDKSIEYTRKSLIEILTFTIAWKKGQYNDHKHRKTDF